MKTCAPITSRTFTTQPPSRDTPKLAEPDPDEMSDPDISADGYVSEEYYRTQEQCARALINAMAEVQVRSNRLDPQVNFSALPLSGDDCSYLDGEDAHNRHCQDFIITPQHLEIFEPKYALSSACCSDDDRASSASSVYSLGDPDEFSGKFTDRNTKQPENVADFSHPNAQFFRRQLPLSAISEEEESLKHTDTPVIRVAGNGPRWRTLRLVLGYPDASERSSWLGVKKIGLVVNLERRARASDAHAARPPWRP